MADLQLQSQLGKESYLNAETVKLYFNAFPSGKVVIGSQMLHLTERPICIAESEWRGECWELTLTVPTSGSLAFNRENRDSCIVYINDHAIYHGGLVTMTINYFSGLVAILDLPSLGSYFEIVVV